MNLVSLRRRRFLGREFFSYPVNCGSDILKLDKGSAMRTKYIFLPYISISK